MAGDKNSGERYIDVLDPQVHSTNFKQLPSLLSQILYSPFQIQIRTDIQNNVAYHISRAYLGQVPFYKPTLHLGKPFAGAGNFGSCLADHLGDSEHDVFLWSRKQEVVDHFNEHHKNLEYLKDHSFSQNIKMVGPKLPDR